LTIHENIRSLRKSRGLRIKDVARRIQLSEGYISQIETGKVEPSIAILRKFASIFQVPIVTFFNTNYENTILVRKDKRKTFGTQKSSIIYELLSPDLVDKKMQVAILKLAPFFRDPDGLFLSHHGEECIYVVKNQLKFIRGEESFLLEEGDSVYFEGLVPYRIENATDKETVILGVITPPLI